ncbi:Oidioi.mRNA.OKI2018_I69.XSR.g14366.t1.cds [Oikopleura dioica]|uniref:Oidioi.mRNA.OKI2018_I69.XSR.g14366.t1.cds n=1 Tax=Oikopleura dioica TaxID=34765 RepID=A0ABN7SA38_OIKDI|nr:Oidioi.mRNA.OKI2018_I69.XSR.g14366.t1.cds [Oikopleura dioica]
MRKKIDSHDDYLTNQGVKIEALTEDSTSLSNDLADIKMTVHENLSNLKLVAGQNKNDLDAMKEKFNSLYKSMETMTNGEEFVAQLAKIERVVSLSNSTVLSSLSDAKQKILELKTEYETDLKKLTNSLSITESKLSASIAQQVKK